MNLCENTSNKPIKSLEKFYFNEVIHSAPHIK